MHHLKLYTYMGYYGKHVCHTTVLLMRNDDDDDDDDDLDDQYQNSHELIYNFYD